MNRNKEYRLKRKSQKKDYIIQDKNLTIKTLYYRNETKRNKIEQLEQKNKQLQNNWNELKKLIDERIGDCRYFLANADVNYEKAHMKKFMWLKEELQVLKSKAQEMEQGKDE